MRKFLKNGCRRGLAVCLAMGVMLTSSFSANAVTTETSNPVIVNGYSCYESKGVYRTQIDGKSYIVLQATEENKVTDEALIAKLNQQLAASTRAALPDYDIDICSTPYEGSVDITSGDYYSPTFKIKDDDESYTVVQMKTNFILTTKVNVGFYHYLETTREWYYNYLPLAFSALTQTESLLIDSASRTACRCHFTIFQEGTGKNKFNYTLSQI